MESFTLAVASIIAVTFLPLLTHANPTDATNSSKPYYCNVTRYFPRTSIEEVSHVILDAVAVLNDTCNKKEVECILNITIAPKQDLVSLQDLVNAGLEILLGKLQRINGLCETEETNFYRGDISLIKICNMLKCKTKLVIEIVTKYLLDHKCGCVKGCNYNPERYIEFTDETTVIILLQKAYNDVSFLQNIIARIDAPMITDSTIPPAESGDGRSITDPAIPEPDEDVD